AESLSRLLAAPSSLCRDVVLSVARRSARQRCSGEWDGIVHGECLVRQVPRAGIGSRRRRRGPSPGFGMRTRRGFGDREVYLGRRHHCRCLMSLLVYVDEPVGASGWLALYGDLSAQQLLLQTWLPLWRLHAVDPQMLPIGEPDDGRTIKEHIDHEM